MSLRSAPWFMGCSLAVRRPSRSSQAANGRSATRFRMARFSARVQSLCCSREFDDLSAELMHDEHELAAVRQHWITVAPIFVVCVGIVIVAFIAIGFVPADVLGHDFRDLKGNAFLI